jgi:hypothetical protein
VVGFILELAVFSSALAACLIYARIYRFHFEAWDKEEATKSSKAFAKTKTKSRLK